MSGGLHGVGVSVVNALSRKLIAQVKRDGKIYEMQFERGKTSEKMKEVGTTKTTGTIITFWPDDLIFETTTYNYDTLHDRLQETAFLNKNLKITLTDERELTPRVDEFCYSGGIIDFVKFLNDGKEVLAGLSKPIYIEGKSDPDAPVAQMGEVEVSMEISNGKGDLFVITENGYGKRTPVAEYPEHNRGGQGVFTITMTAKKGKLVACRVVGPQHELMSVLVCLATPVAILVGSGIAALVPQVAGYLGNSGAHGFSELLYNFSSAGGNNGSAFAGMRASRSSSQTSMPLSPVPRSSSLWTSWPIPVPRDHATQSATRTSRSSSRRASTCIPPSTSSTSRASTTV